MAFGAAPTESSAEQVSSVLLTKRVFFTTRGDLKVPPVLEGHNMMLLLQPPGIILYYHYNRFFFQGHRDEDDDHDDDHDHHH